MVVVVIIGVLVAIAVPVYTNVQKSAANNANAANIRIIDGAIAQWQAENAGANIAAYDGVAAGHAILGYLQQWPKPPAAFGAGAVYANVAGRAVGPNPSTTLVTFALSYFQQEASSSTREGLAFLCPKTAKPHTKKE